MKLIYDCSLMKVASHYATILAYAYVYLLLAMLMHHNKLNSSLLGYFNQLIPKNNCIGYFLFHKMHFPVDSQDLLGQR